MPLRSGLMQPMPTPMQSPLMHHSKMCLGNEILQQIRH
jgi:hypothetical protein